MRVLLVNHFPLPDTGSGVYTENIAKSLSALGHEVCIIMPENISNYQKVSGVKLHPIFFKYKETIQGQLDFNFGYFSIHPRSKQSFYSLTDEQVNQYLDTFKKAIEEEIRIFKPDIIHCQHIWLASSVAVDFDIPVVITSHGTDIMGFERTSRFDKFAIKAVDKSNQLITISQDNNKEVLKRFPNAENKINLLLNSYDNKVFFPKKYNKFEVLKSLGIEKSFDKVISYTGKITYSKGTDLLIEAIKASNLDDSTLTLISGFGDMFNELKTTVETLKLKNVKFLGQQSHQNLQKIYNISDVLVVPSRQEAFGLVALEALACGTPVIASSIGGLPDIVTKDVGILVEENNPSQLSIALTNILNKNICFNQQLISNYAKTKFSNDIYINKLLDIYKKCIK